MHSVLETYMISNSRTAIFSFCQFVNGTMRSYSFIPICTRGTKLMIVQVCINHHVCVFQHILLGFMDIKCKSKINTQRVPCAYYCSHLLTSLDVIRRPLTAHKNLHASTSRRIVVRTVRFVVCILASDRFIGLL